MKEERVWTAEEESTPPITRLVVRSVQDPSSSNRKARRRSRAWRERERGVVGALGDGGGTDGQ
jgi:hypothetical protein